MSRKTALLHGISLLTGCVAGLLLGFIFEWRPQHNGTVDSTALNTLPSDGQNYFGMKLGERRVYLSGDESISMTLQSTTIDMRGRLIYSVKCIDELGNTDFDHFHVGKQGISRVSGNISEEAIDQYKLGSEVRLKLPISVGDKWSTYILSANVMSEYRCVAQDVVSTPVGQFPTELIETTIPQLGVSSIRRRYWYNHSVGLVQFERLGKVYVLSERS